MLLELVAGSAWRAQPGFRSTRSLQKISAVHASVSNRFNQERHLYSRADFMLKRAATLAEWRQLGAA
jgi:putative transposase